MLTTEEKTNAAVVSQPPVTAKTEPAGEFQRKFTGERQSSSGYIPALDGIRGIAMIMVLLAHWGQSITSIPIHGYLKNTAMTLAYVGHTGLDSFFVLSGFLITRILLAIKHKPMAIPNFLVRRMLKIFPLYFATLAVVLFLIPAPFRDVQLRMAGSEKHWIWLWCFGQNFVDVANHNWVYGALDHFWSVSVEEHFYWVWPFLIMGLCRRNVGWASVGLIAVSLISRAYFYFAQHDPFACELLTFCRLDGLALGCLLAVMEAGGKLTRKLTPWCLAAIVAGLSFSVSVHHDLFMPWGPVVLKSIESIVCCGIIALAVLYKDAWFGRALSHPFLTFFGVYSYGIYVYHHFFRPPLLPVTILFGADKPNNAAFAYGVIHVGIAIILALISYHFFEKHFLKFKVKFSAGEAKL